MIGGSKENQFTADAIYQQKWLCHCIVVHFKKKLFGMWTVYQTKQGHRLCNLGLCEIVMTLFPSTLKGPNVPLNVSAKSLKHVYEHRTGITFTNNTS